jgi:hypothetical protein
MKRKKVGDLELHQDLEFQRKEWTAERIGWLAMALVTLLALTGLFGTGPLSSIVRGDAGDIIWLEYNRFGRMSSPSTTIVFHVNSEAISEGEVRIWIEEEYLDKFDVERITPQPDKISLGDDRWLFVFTVEPSEDPAEVKIKLNPSMMGRISGKAGLVGEPGFTINHFIYP